MSGGKHWQVFLTGGKERVAKCFDVKEGGVKLTVESHGGGRKAGDTAEDMAHNDGRV